MHYILTGCSSGLGFEILNKLLHSGCVVTGLSRTLGRAAVHEHNSMFDHVVCDLRSDEDLNKIDPLRDGRAICLVVNAAQFNYEGDGALSAERTSESFDVNYFSAVKLVEKFKNDGLARVLFINSVAGVEAQTGQAQYSASKHALQAYSQVLAKFSVGKNFDVMSINPGGLDTELWRSEEILEKSITDKFIKPKVLAEMIWSCLCLPHKTYIKSAVILPEHDI